MAKISFEKEFYTEAWGRSGVSICSGVYLDLHHFHRYKSRISPERAFDSVSFSPVNSRGNIVKGCDFNVPINYIPQLIEQIFVELGDKIDFKIIAGAIGRAYIRHCPKDGIG